MSDVEEELVHPLLDAAGPGWVVTESAAEVLYLGAGVSDLLARAAQAGRRPVVVSNEFSRMTEPLAEALSDLNGAWVIRTAAGYHDARTGTALARPADALRLPPPDARTIAEDYLRAALVSHVRLVVSFATRHRTSRVIRLGGVATEVAGLVTGAAPAAWGATEPVVAPWNRDELTEYSRRRMPDDSRWALVGDTGHRMVGTIRAARTSEGVEETTRLHIDQGPLGDPRHGPLAATATEALRAAAGHGLPLMGFAFAHLGARDLTRRPHFEAPIAPLALFVGPAGVRQMGEPVSTWTGRFGATVVGNPRIPGVLVELGTVDGGGWEMVDRIMSTLDQDKMLTLFGIDPTLVEHRREGGRNG